MRRSCADGGFLLRLSCSPDAVNRQPVACSSVIPSIYNRLSIKTDRRTRCACVYAMPERRMKGKRVGIEQWQLAMGSKCAFQAIV